MNLTNVLIPLEYIQVPWNLLSAEVSRICEATLETGWFFLFMVDWAKLKTEFNAGKGIACYR